LVDDVVIKKRFDRKNGDECAQPKVKSKGGT